jgi:hypothetical protein
MTCTVCGDPAIGFCTRMHRQWTIIQPREIRPDGAMYAVSKAKTRVTDGDPGMDEYVVETKQKKRFLVLYPALPVLVKRDVVCGWPRCEFHCGKCMNLAQQDSDREEILRSANAVNSQAANDREKERHKHKNTKRGLRKDPAKINNK